MRNVALINHANLSDTPSLGADDLTSPGLNSPDLNTLGRLPVDVHGVGVMYPRWFPIDADYFDTITSGHEFQSLTESNKQSNARRTGIYLTDVAEREGELHFRLLRCSTNLSGATECFSAVDRQIVAELNSEAERVFINAAPLNHVLAQVYPNTVATETQKQSKARIKAHADKTKDMPENGVMAFCTFYDQLDHLEPLDGFDWGRGKVSGLTSLNFRLKAGVEGDYAESFSVTLYPGSVFMMPLSTNRLYTHAIGPSMLDAAFLPTRLGYVVRCSKTEAIHRGDATYIKTPTGLTPLVPPTDEGIDALKDLYAEENRLSTFVDYGDRFDFSLNDGDYEAPLIR